jgi:hypothetical protein
MYIWRMAIRYTYAISADHAVHDQPGVKHYRDGLNQYAQPFQYENAEMLGQAGIKADWLMDINNSASIINSAYANAPDATAEFEGPNEDDAEAGPTASGVHAIAQRYRSRNPATAAMPIIAPSFTQVSSFARKAISAR